MRRTLALGLIAAIGCMSAMGADFYNRSFQCDYYNSTVFVSGFQRFARLRNSDNQLHTRYNPSAVALGYTYSRDIWTVGAAFTYESGQRRYRDGFFDDSYRVRSHTPGISLFGGVKLPSGWYADANLFTGFSTLKARSYQDAFGYISRGNTVHNTQFAAGLEVGKAFDMSGGFRIKPHVGFDYAYSPGERYRFNDGVDIISIAQKRQNFFEIPLGVSFSKAFDCGNWTITPEVDVTLVNSIGRMDGLNHYPGFAAMTNSGWKVYGIGGGHIGGRVTTGVNAKMNERTSFGLDYTYEGRKGYNDHRLSAMVGWSF